MTTDDRTYTSLVAPKEGERLEESSTGASFLGKETDTIYQNNVVFTALINQLEYDKTIDKSPARSLTQDPESSTGHAKPESPIYVNQIPTPDYENVPSVGEEDK